MSIDKVKSFWKTVVKEREDFWSSLFSKYEDDEESASANLEAYLDNSTNRLSHLLSLSTNEGIDEKRKNYSPYIYYEEQPKPSYASDTEEESDVDTGNEKDVPFTQLKPEFVSEIFTEENSSDEPNCPKTPTKKLVLVDPQPKKDSCLSISTCESTPPDNNFESQSSDESIKPPSPNSVRYICRPTKRTNPARKRFRLV